MRGLILEDIMQADSRQLGAVCSLITRAKQITRIRSRITHRNSEAEVYSQKHLSNLSG